MSISAELGERRTVELEAGVVAYRERGEGPALVFLHGALVNGDLWRKVVPLLADRFRCVTPDLPLGAHELPMKADADLTPPGIASLVAELIEKVVGEPAVIVANDTGGGMAQVLAARHPDAVAGLVLTTCDAFWNFPPHSLKPTQPLGYIPGGVWPLAQLLASPAMRRKMFASVARERIPDEILASWARPLVESAAIRRDFARFFRSVRPRHTRRAARALRRFDKPALVVWTDRVPFFPARHGRKLAELIPGARYEQVTGSRAFVPEDRPERLAELIAETLAT